MNYICFSKVSSSDKMIRVSIIENDKFLCETLKVVLHAKEAIDVVSIYLNAEDAIKELPQIKPEIVLVDIDLGMNTNHSIYCQSKAYCMNQALKN